MSHRRNLIILITPGFAASESDSSCLPLQQALVRAWRRLVPGLEVAVLALHYPYTGEAYALFGARVYPFDGRNRGGWRRWTRAQWVQRCLEDLQHRYHVRGVLSCWYGETAALGAAFAKTHALPHYCWLLGQDARPGNPWPARVALPASELVALSPSLQDTFSRNYGIYPSRVVLPGVEKTTIAPPGNRTIDILGVGSLIPLKRWTVFLQVVALIRTSYPSVRALLIGDGPDRGWLLRETQQLGLSDAVQFAGALPHEAVLQHMAHARVLLHPSEYEGYSGVCQEALSVGTAVVSCVVPGMELPEGWWQAEGVEALAEAVSSSITGNGISPRHFPIEEAARHWLHLFGIDADEDRAASNGSSAPAMAPNEKFL